MSGELQVQQLGKAYPHWNSESRRILSWFIHSITPNKEHWVLKDINFSISPGETVGIVGTNGAGKSTLLKLITGTIRPTQGSVHKHGRVAAILELGMGFNPELTGKQNAYHSAGLMGYNRSEIEAAMPSIEAFAEVGDYFNQPIRTYSSGMQMRVAFSVATAFKPDLLIIDEVLSVGDSYFQHKSFDRIRQFKRDGVSIMLVSHNVSDVRTLCDRAILLDKGRIIKDGQPNAIMDYYNALIVEKENAIFSCEQRREKNGWLMTKSGTGEVYITSLQLFDSLSGNEVTVVQVGQALELHLNATATTDINQLVLGFMIRDKQGHVVWGTNTWHTQQIQKDIKAGEKFLFKLSFTCTLGPGSYSISPALHSTDTHLINNYEWVDNWLVFDVFNIDKPVFMGNAYLEACFSISRQLEGCNV